MAFLYSIYTSWKALEKPDIQHPLIESITSIQDALARSILIILKNRQRLTAAKIAPQPIKLSSAEILWTWYHLY